MTVLVIAPAPDAGAQQAHVSAHDPAEGSDADVLMTDAAGNDAAAEPVVSGVPFSMQEPGGRKRRRARARNNRAHRKRNG